MFHKPRLFLIGLIFILAIFLLGLRRNTSTNVQGINSDEQIIKQLAEDIASSTPELLQPEYLPFKVNIVRIEQDWAFLSLTSFPNHVNATESHGVFPDVLLAVAEKDTTQSWAVFLETSPAFKQIVALLPSSLLSDESKEILLSAPSRGKITQLAPYSIVGLPWQVGTSWRYNQGPHGGDQGALDFGTPVIGQANTVRAADSGTVIYASETCIAVQRSGDSLRLWYQHIRSSDIANWDVGDPISLGDAIGLTTTSPGCGGSSSGHHLHFFFNLPGGSVDPQGSSYNGWVLTGSQLIRCGQIANPNQSDTLLHSNMGSCCCACLPIFPQGNRAGQLPEPNFANQYGNDGFSVNGLIDNVPPSCEVEALETTWSNIRQLQPVDWPAAADESGVAGYYIYWGPDPNGEGDIWVTEPSYTPTMSDSVEGMFYLRAAAKDNVGNISSWFTVATWGYDTQSPTGTLTVQGSVDTVQTLPIYLSITPVVDDGSPVSMMRFSKDGEVWLDWEPFATTRPWLLGDEAQPQTIYAQIQDASGNLSTVMTTTVRVDLTLHQPSGSGFTISCSTFAMSAGTQTGSSYTVHSTVGQPYETGQMQGGNYQVKSGYWSACDQSSTPPPTTNHIYLPLLSNP